MSSLCTKSTFTRPATPQIGAAKKPHYRRSVNCKAPRKRTFIANMEKYSPGVRSEGAGGVLCKANANASTELLQSCCGGDDGIMGGNNGINGRPVRPTGGDNSFNGSSFNGLPRTLILGGLVLCGLVLLPSQAVASSPSRRSGRVAAAPSSPRGVRAMCLNHTTPTTGTPVPEDAIVYGQVQLSEAERRLLSVSTRQMFFRETLRSEALCR